MDLVAFTGHKGLLGPTGIGGLMVGPDVEPRSTRWGGTGVRSLELDHPQQWPYRLEAGTLNTVGICRPGRGPGLVAGARPAGRAASTNAAWRTVSWRGCATCRG